MTIWRHWCRGCGARIEAYQDGYCAAEECRGQRTTEINKALNGVGSRECLLGALAEWAKVVPAGVASRVALADEITELTRQLKAEPYDLIDPFRWEQFEALKAGKPLPRTVMRRDPGAPMHERLFPNEKYGMAKYDPDLDALGVVLARPRQGAEPDDAYQARLQSWFGGTVFDHLLRNLDDMRGKALEVYGVCFVVHRDRGNPSDKVFRERIRETMLRLRNEAEERQLGTLKTYPTLVDDVRRLRSEGRIDHEYVMKAQGAVLDAVGVVFNIERLGLSDDKEFRKYLTMEVPELQPKQRNRNPVGTGNNGFTPTGDPLKVRPPFADAAGRHLDDVARANGVVRKPGEDDVTLRMRLQTYFAEREAHPLRTFKEYDPDHIAKVFNVDLNSVLRPKSWNP